MSHAVGLSIPAIRGKQGSRTMYLVLAENAVLNTFFSTEVEAPEDSAQRPLDPRHARDIADYIVGNPDEYVLGALTYAADREGVFDEVLEGTGVGILQLPLDVRLRSVDGQHRRVGIRQALQRARDVENQHTGLLIYVERDVTKRRQMFSDMNNTPRKVSKALNVAFDSRDPFARAVKRLITEHPLLEDRVETLSVRVQSGSHHLFTLGAVHDAAKRLFVGPNGRVKDPGKYSEDGVFERCWAFFDLLQQARPELATTDSESLDELRARSILLSSTTLRVLAGALWTLNNDLPGAAFEPSRMVDVLRAVDFSPNADVWVRCGFVSPGKATPNARNQEMQAATDALAALLRPQTTQSNVESTMTLSGGRN